MSGSLPDLTVVMPVHNGLDYTARCLRALLALENGFGIVLVDDGSSDGTAEYVAEHYPSVHVVYGSGDLWWSGSINAGCRFAIRRGAKRLLLLNNDNVEFSSNFISRLDQLVAETGACVAAVTLEQADSGTQTILAVGGSIDWRNRGAQLRATGEPYVAHDAVVECDWLPGNSLTFDAATFEEVGGFDARRFPQYRGDIDFTLRARAAGRRCFVIHDVWVVNDLTQNGLNFRRRLSVRDFLTGLISLRSPYNLRESVAFAFRHCPSRQRARYLLLFYLRYAYGCLKTRALPRSMK